MHSSNRKSQSKVAAFSVPEADPLAFLFERHRYNPFVRFLRAAFFYEDDDPARLTRDRVHARAHGGKLRY